MQPRQIRDTSKPLRPSFVYSSLGSPSVLTQQAVQLTKTLPTLWRRLEPVPHMALYLNEYTVGCEEGPHGRSDRPRSARKDRFELSCWQTSAVYRRQID